MWEQEAWTKALGGAWRQLVPDLESEMSNSRCMRCRSVPWVQLVGGDDSQEWVLGVEGAGWGEQCSDWPGL